MNKNEKEKKEKSVKRGSIGSGAIRALCLELLGLYIAVNGVIWGRSDSEAPIDHQTLRQWGGSPYLGLRRTEGKDVACCQSLSREEYGRVL